jgi:L-rhamnonate dehydratase
MNRRSFLKLSAVPALGLTRLAPVAFAQEKSKLKITGVRLVNTRPKTPEIVYTPAPGSWSTGGVEVANPMSIYPKYKPMRSLYSPEPGKMPSFTVEITTDKGVKGYGNGGPGGGVVVTDHFAKLLMNEDPFDVERLWDTMWRSSMPYGRMGIAINAISGVDLALWDLIGNALQMPVYKLIGGATKERIPSYCTGNDIEQHIKFGFKRL